MILVGLFNQNYGSLPINVSKVKDLERRMPYLYLSASSELFFLLKTSFFLFIHLCSAQGSFVYSWVKPVDL